MGHTLEIIVYGGGGLFAEYFNAIVAAIGTDTFSTLIRMTVLLAGTTALFSAITKRDFLVCVRWFAIYYLVFYIIFIPKVDVVVIDRTAGNKHHLVSNVPLGLGVLANLSTKVGDALTQLTDKIFSMPDDLRYSKTGMLMGSKMVLASRQFQITDSVLQENMRQFVTHCVFWDILLNKYTLDDLVTAPNVWEFVKTNASPARSCLYTDDTGKSQITVCNKVIISLERALKDNLTKVAAYNAARIFPDKNPVEAKRLFMQYLPISYGHLLNTSNTATDLLQQSVMANAIMDGTLHFGVGANSQTAVSSYANAKAQEQQRLTQNTLGFLAGYWLPIMKNAFEAIMYGCFIFVVLLSLFPFGLYILRNYVYTLFWIQAWAPLYAVINLICTYYSQIQSTGYAQNGFVLKDMSGLMQVNHDMASLAGYLTMSVPFIAAGIAKGMAGTMTHVAQFMGGVSQSAGSQAASEAVSGNISMGMTSMRNNSSFNTSSFQNELRGRTSTGASYQLPSGESINFMSDGNIAVDRGGTLSNLGVDVNLAESIHGSAMQQADHAYSTAKGESISAGENYTAGMRDLYELSEHVGVSKGSGESWAYSENSGAVQALNKTKELTQDFADSHQVSYDHAKDILSRAHGGLGIDVSANTPSIGGNKIGISGKGNAGLEGIMQHSDRATEQKLYKQAEDFIKRSGYSENIEVATRAMHDRNFHSNNDQGARLLDSATGHFERAESLRKDSNVHFQDAQSYRNVASYAQDNAVNVNVNASQAFLKHISNESSMAGGKPKGVMTALREARDPETLKIMADNFARSYAKNHLSDWGKGVSNQMITSDEGIKKVYQTNAFNKEVVEQDLLNERYSIGRDRVSSLAKQKELTAVDSSAREVSEGVISKQREQVKDKEEQLVQTGLNKGQEFNHEVMAAKSNRGKAKYDAAMTVLSRITEGKIKSPGDKIREKLDEEK